MVVPVKREELVVEHIPLDASALPGQPDTESDGHPQPREFNLVLSQEEVVVDTRMVPVERVRVWVETVVEHRSVEEVLRREVVDTEEAEQR